MSTDRPRRKRRRSSNVANTNDSLTNSDSPTRWPRRNLNRLYCPVVTHLCSMGALPSYSPVKRSRPCISCAYKIGNFDVALDYDFTSRVPNVRPEQCLRSIRNSSHAAFAHGLEGSSNTMMGYQPGMYVLTVGDGDFTFSLAVARVVIDQTACLGERGLVLATSYEAYNTLRKVYCDLDDTLNSLKPFGDNVFIGYTVDATKLNETLPVKFTQKSSDFNKKFHRICWNFPCIAVSSGRDGQNDAMDINKELVRKFIANALPYLDEEIGEIHMAHKTKPPFNQWELEKVALEYVNHSKNETKYSCTRKFEFKGRVVFDQSIFPPYTPRKALDRKSFPCHDACIYIFGWKTQLPSLVRKEQNSFQSTILNHEMEYAQGKDLNLYSVIPVTETMIDLLRTKNLKYTVNDHQNEFSSDRKGAASTTQSKTKNACLMKK